MVLDTRPPRPAGPTTTTPTTTLDRSQIMAKQLQNGAYECMICTETIAHRVATWACKGCYRVFHLQCVKEWAHSEGSGAGSSFRCPSCQQLYDEPPRHYMCFCGKRRDPKTDGFVTPHSCGEVCGRRRDNDCPHTCTAPCHPGPCSECGHTAPPRRCPCGKKEYAFPCGRPDPRLTCNDTCDKLLNCGVHRCPRPCHFGPCSECPLTVERACRCGKHTALLPCGETAWSCKDPCGKLQRCGEHRCQTVCHAGSCPPCDADPGVVYSCPCGKMPVPEGARLKCTDPVPLCGERCGRVLGCGRHTCDEPCHHGPCKPCRVRVDARCVCGSTTKRMPCNEATNFRCHKKCKAMLKCGKHECATVCCPHRRNPDVEAHPCTRICNKQLPCGHPCLDNCHRGACNPCPNIITHDLVCACGTMVLEPPLACGTQPPTCHRPCEKALACGHRPIQHDCHYGPCPPCTHKVDRPCFGGHTTVKAVMCSAGPTSCGQPCAKPLPCGHPCQRLCHDGLCVDPVKPVKCKAQCGKVLSHCGHKCQATCHPKRDECPRCTATEELPCECGIRTVKVPCADFQRLLTESKEQQRFSSKAQQETGAARGDDNDAEDDAASPPPAPAKALCAPCTPECDYERRLAALASVADTSSRGDFFGTATAGSGGGGNKPTASAASSSQHTSTTLYSFALWAAAQQNPAAVAAVEAQLSDFVRTQKKVMMLPPMNRERRALIHELAHYYNVSTAAVDREPNRSIELTRHVHSFIPRKSLTDSVGHAPRDPSVVCRAALASLDVASKRVLVFEGPPEVVTTGSVNQWLRSVAGLYIQVAAGDMASVFPNGVVPKPLPSNGEETIAILAVFGNGVDAATAFSHVRVNGIPGVFHWYGSGAPPKNFSTPHDRARYFCDAKSTSPPQGAPGTAGGGGKSGGGKGGSWAQMVSRPTSRQKEAARPVSLTSTNAFGVLRK